MCTFLQTLEAAAATIYSTTLYQAAVCTFPPFSAAGGNGGSLIVVKERKIKRKSTNFHRAQRKMRERLRDRSMLGLLKVRYSEMANFFFQKTS